MARQHKRSTHIKRMNRIEVQMQFDKWEWAIEAINDEREQFLTDSGWRHTSEKLSRWFWTKDGMYVDFEVALDIEMQSRSEPDPYDCFSCGALLGNVIYFDEHRNFLCEKCGVGKDKGTDELVAYLKRNS